MFDLLKKFINSKIRVHRIDCICGDKIYTPHPRLGSRVTCPKCGAKYTLCKWGKH